MTMNISQNRYASANLRADRRLPICSFLRWNEVVEKIDIDKNVRKYDNIENKRHKCDEKAIL